MLSRKSAIEHPVISVITVGLCPSDIINTLSPLTNALVDPRVEFVVVTPLTNIDSVANYISAVFVPDQGEGVYQAMNLGISASRGDYLWFLNSGDESLLTPGSFASLLSFLSREKLKAVNSALLVFGFQPLGANKPWIHFLPSSLLKLLILLSIMPVSHQNILFLRSHHKPFSIQYQYSCDFEILADLILVSKCDVLFASSKPIAKLVAGGISDSNRLSVFRERYTILSGLPHNCFSPIVIIGFLVRSLRELVTSTIKFTIGLR